MDLDEMLEELNDSDVADELVELNNSIGCLEQNETKLGYLDALSDSIDATEALLKSLLALRKSILDKRER
jgi:hypothetical protein